MTPVLQINGVQKRYQSLRPLRIRELTIAAAERVAVSGFDAGAAEVLVNLVTGASLPDQGEVRVLGHRTADIVGGDEWLASLDRFGIVSPRGVLVETFTIEQNLAMPLTLEIDPVPPDVAARVVGLARECRILDLTGGEDGLQRITGEAAPAIRARVHLARAIALRPALLILEHAGAELEADERLALADCVAGVAEAGGIAALVISKDDDFAKRAAHRALRLEAATGALKPIKRGWFR
jgi:predicted ABC-type transport system involved in lysophospholipase L1 biosynthesis ATPase subunit